MEIWKLEWVLSQMYKEDKTRVVQLSLSEVRVSNQSVFCSRKV